MCDTDGDDSLLGARELVIGSYEHVVYGIGLQVAAKSSSEVEVLMHRSFATEAHGGGITALAASGSIVVSGSADELIKCVRASSGRCYSRESSRASYYSQP